MENVKEIIAENLVTLRKSRRMTQQELAEKLNYSDKAISRWEHAETLPDIETLCKICEIYGVKFEYLLQKEQAPANKNPYVIRNDTSKKTAIVLIAILSVWLIALIAYAYSNWIVKVNRWQLFIWAIPVSSMIWQFCNRLWGNKILGRIITSITSWTLILAIYISMLQYNIWMIFIIGIPIQLIIILSAALKKTK